MKKLLLIPALLLGGALSAQDYKYEITPVVGYDIAEGNINLDNQLLLGAELQYNTDTYLKPELTLLYTNSDYENSSASTDIYRMAINGVHEFNSIGMFVPLAKIGAGYETLNNRFSGNRDSVFVDAGVGAKLPLTSNIALKLEAIYMLKDNSNRWDNNLALLAGINFAFGGTTKTEAPKQEPVVVKEEPKAAPAVVKEEPKAEPVKQQEPLKEEVVAAVAASVAVVDGDDDKDGVLNSVDKCPTTPAGDKVDENGCSKIVNLHVNFETASSKVDTASKVNIKEFADFLKARTEYSAEIVGHTDNAGKKASNQKLSEKRAAAVKKLIVAEGVDVKRIKASGMGQMAPIADNKTAEGKAQNRRIEAKLIKN
ncbi:OmpA family protein [Sulfurimonas sp.]|uniref:OmpA family protein n=1 Tax=Sulfurimonas sp. TaxID=2022749 RepID=UPI0025E6B536|nr:OmpA family protein [Sulfurimonas sp.]MDD5157644.1 OmpA family protein [Sulfurimonas sp.]